MARKNKDSNDLEMGTYIRSYSVIKLILSPDFLRAMACTNVFLFFVVYFSIKQESIQDFYQFHEEISEMILSNIIGVNISIFSIIVAAIAIYATFHKIEIFNEMYLTAKSERRLHQYLLILFYPVFPAITAIFLTFIGNLLLISNSIYSSIVALVALFFTFYCIFSVLEAILQITNTVISQAKYFPKNNISKK